jgi:Ca2+-transporting ATPase
MPVLKRPLAAQGAPKIGAGIEDCFWASAGTRVLTGAAQVRVAFTGADTIYGQIVRSVQAERSDRTPLQRAIGDLVAALIGVAAFACLALALVRYAQGHGFADALLSAATLAVAALPEEFPVVFTFFLGVGVFRLAQRKALVRRGVAVENIGRVTCICTDKTGALTEGRLTLEHVIPAAGVSHGDLLSTAALASRQESADPIDTAIRMRAQRP